jgi:hypothetical protein
MKTTTKEEYSVGSSKRLAQRDLQLTLQGLPASIARIKAKSQFKQDTCPAFALATFKIERTFSTGELVIGPKPVLCVPNPGDMEAMLRTDPSPILTGK